jgi:hypothetical protein
VLKLALRSEHLQLASENDAYALASGWVASLPKEERKSAFNELARCLRFHHMSPLFLSTAVLRSMRWKHCPLLAQACSGAIAYQSLISSFSEVPSEHSTTHPFTSVQPSRAPDEDVTYSFEVPLELSDCLRLGVDEEIQLRLGVAEGYAVTLIVEWDAKAALSLYVKLKFPDLRVMREEETDSVGLSGPMAAIRLVATGSSFTDSFIHVFESGVCYGQANYFKRPWEEVRLLICQGVR